MNSLNSAGNTIPKVRFKPKRNPLAFFLSPSPSRGAKKTDLVVRKEMQRSERPLCAKAAASDEIQRTDTALRERSP